MKLLNTPIPHLPTAAIYYDTQVLKSGGQELRTSAVGAFLLLEATRFHCLTFNAEIPGTSLSSQSVFSPTISLWRRQY